MESLIILHGWQSSKEKWQRVKEEIEAQGITVIVPDLPGFKTENGLKKAWDLDNYVEWVKNFIEERAREPFFLLGHSFGGRVAIKFALKYPERLRGLILVSAAGITPRPKIKINAFLLLAKTGNLIFSLPILKSLQSLAKKFLYFLTGSQRTDYPFIESQFLKETFKQVISEDLTPLLSRIKAPTLILWGKNDKATPLKDAYLMREKIEDSKIEILKDIGHTPHLENPELFSQEVIRFFETQN